MIKIDSIKNVSYGTLKGFATATVGGIKISDIKIIQQEGQKPWISLPSREFEVEGQKKYKPIVEIVDPDLKGALAAAILDAYYQGR